MAVPLLALAGLGGVIGGGILAGNAADMARNRLESVANTPGLDVDAETLNALLTMEKYLPRAKSIGSSMTDYSRGEIEKSMETALEPAYLDGIGEPTAAVTGRSSATGRRIGRSWVSSRMDRPHRRSAAASGARTWIDSRQGRSARATSRIELANVSGSRDSGTASAP